MAAFLVIVPGTVAGLVPWLVVTLFPWPLEGNGYRWIGWVVMAVAGCLYARCTYDLMRFGAGVPAPLEPTQFVVQKNLYQYTRNPMYLAGILFFLGEAIVFMEGTVFLYTFAVIAVYHPAVVYLEEPALRQRFGASYQHYCDQVPRWLPRAEQQPVGAGVLSESGHLPPGPRSFLSIRETYALFRDLIGFLEFNVKTHGDLFSLRIGSRLLCVANHPDLIQDVLVTQHKVLEKTWILPSAKDVLGNGMLTSKGEFHRQQRKLIQPALHRQRIAGYAEIMIRLAAEKGDRWKDGAPVDMAQEMMRLTLSVVAQTLFGSDIGEEADDVGRCITELTEAYAQVKSPVSAALSRIPFLPRNRRFERARHRLDETIFGLIARRRNSHETRDDLLSMLLNARCEEDGSTMSDQQVRDEAVALFLAGHETTSNVLTWTWYLLSQSPDVEAEYQQELQSVLQGRCPVPEDLERLPFSRKVLTEALRLYPPAYLVPRLANAPCTLGGYSIPPEALVFINIYHVQRDPRFFRDPEVFNPHRWTPEMKEALPRYAFCPFGGGPHACLGEHFAWAEGILIMAVLAQRWRAVLKAGHRVTLNPLVNLRPRGGMPMTLHRRDVPWSV
jgi:cytochrome P450/protein-S-isoprenylcysteine O-methyltransferase Ste14